MDLTRRLMSSQENLFLFNFVAEKKSEREQEKSLVVIPFKAKRSSSSRLSIINLKLFFEGHLLFGKKIDLISRPTSQQSPLQSNVSNTVKGLAVTSYEIHNPRVDVLIESACHGNLGQLQFEHYLKKMSNINKLILCVADTKTDELSGLLGRS